MMWKFINFQLKKWREHSQSQASKKKTVSPKSKPHKKEPTRGECTNEKKKHTKKNVQKLYVMKYKDVLDSFY